MNKKEGLDIIIAGIEEYTKTKNITPLELWQVIEQIVLEVRREQ